MRVDAHHHLWDLTVRPQPWMDGPWADPIRRTFRPADLRPRLEEHAIDAAVVVQSSSSYEETRELLALAAVSDRVAGVVGWADLTDPGLPAVLAGMPAGLVGVRHQAEDESDPEWLTRPEVLRGLAAVGEAGLAYDLLITAREFPAALAAVRALPEVRFVLDHAAKPGIAAGEREPWARRITELAALPNATCKLSGLITEAARDARWPGQVRPYARHVLEAFGPDRLMFGSDWPVCLLAGDYADTVAVAEEAVAGLDPAGRAAVLGGTAVRTYRLGPGRR